jgi:hypothetical protein
VGEGPDGGRFLVAAAGNKNAEKAAKRLRRPHLAAIRTNMMSDELMLKLSCKIMGETILLDWEDIEINGQDVPYTSELGEKLLLSKPLFFEFIATTARDHKLFQDEEEKATEKNS